MKNWNGKKICSTKSAGGVIVVAHPFDNLISKNCVPWPPPEIVQKLYQSRDNTGSSDITKRITEYTDMHILR